MVTASLSLALVSCAAMLGGRLPDSWLVAEMTFKQLQPAERANVLALITGLILLGLMLILLVAVGARWARRFVHTSRPKRDPIQDHWYSKPLVPEEKDEG